MKPPVAYYGGKTSLAARIAALLPAHEHYVEPFAGSLAVLLAKPAARMETVNDIDGDLITFWRVLRDRPAELERACALTPHARAEHHAAYTPPPPGDDVERARRVWVRLTQGRAGTLRPTGWRYYQNPAGSSASMPRYLHGYAARIAPAAARLAAVSIECRPAAEVIEAYGRHAGVLIYADPPYLGSVRAGANYQHEMTGEAAHRDLAAALHAARAAVVISGYPSPLYDALYAGWHRADLAAGTGQGNGWARRTEVLWSNRPFATPALFDIAAEGAPA